MTEEDGARIHFNCLLGGRTRVAYDGRQLDLDQDDALAVYSPGKHFQLECTSDCRNIELRITRQLLSQLAGEDTERLDLAWLNETLCRYETNDGRIGTGMWENLCQGLYLPAGFDRPDAVA